MFAHREMADNWQLTPLTRQVQYVTDTIRLFLAEKFGRIFEFQFHYGTIIVYSLCYRTRIRDGSGYQIPEYPTRIFGFFHYPSPTFDTRPIPETRDATRGYPRVPEGTQLGKICWIFSIFRQFFEIFGYFRPNFRIFSATFSATKFSNIFLGFFCQILKFMAIFYQNFKIFGYFPQKPWNFHQNSRNLLPDGYPGYPRLCTRRVPALPDPNPTTHYPSPLETRLFATRSISNSDACWQRLAKPEVSVAH